MGQLAQQVQQMEDKVNTMVHQLQEAKICLFRALRQDMTTPLTAQQTEEVLNATIVFGEGIGARMLYNAREIAPTYVALVHHCPNCQKEHTLESRFCSNECRKKYDDDFPF